MSLTLFFVDAFTSALDRGIAVPADLIRHATPEVLSVHLPRQLWARLLTACLGAPRVDAGVIVDTIGIPNLCEHLPKPLLWTCLAELAATALGAPREPAMAPTAVASSAPTPTPAPVAPRAASADTLLPPPPSARRPGSSADEPRTAPAAAPAEPAALFDSGPARAPTRQPARPLGTSRSAVAAGASTRRPQVAATPPTPPPGATPAAAVPSPPRSLARDLDFEVETDIHMDWKDKEPIPVTDEMVDWPAAEETVGGAQLDRNKR